MEQIFQFSGFLPALASVSNVVGSFSVYFIAAILPCFLWLIFYLRRDRHPEPKNEIISVFVLGALMTVPAVGVEVLLINVIGSLGLPGYVSAIVINIAAIGFIEEFAKYSAVWLKEQAAGQNRYLDEPVDFVIYMVVSALGFAAVENLLFLLPTVQEQLMGSATLMDVTGATMLVSLSLFRSMSAILLHTLCSGIIGYYMAMAFCHRERKIGFLALGFVVVSCLHGLYNFSIMESAGNLSFLFVPLIIILLLALTLYIQFQWLIKMKSVCNMKLK
jgi:RsiW-degrading membrane proteinase PrsW (M82 family)